jgi:hypothetical protein
MRSHLEHYVYPVSLRTVRSLCQSHHEEGRTLRKVLDYDYNMPAPSPAKGSCPAHNCMPQRMCQSRGARIRDQELP